MENRDNAFQESNRQPDKEKSFANRIGEGFGTAARWGQNPTVQGLIAGGAYGLGESIIDKNVNPLTSIPSNALIASTFGAVATPIITPLTNVAAKSAPKIFNEFAERLNPNNYEKTWQTKAKKSGIGMSKRTVYEPELKYTYKKIQ